MNISEWQANGGLVSFLAPFDTQSVVGTLSAIDGTVVGELSSDDIDNPTRPGSFSDDYSLVDVTAGEQVSISLSASFDTYLQLINADTQEVIDFNDDSGGTLNSLLTFVPEAGINYIVRVTSFISSVTGEYTLSATDRLPDLPDLVVSNFTAPDTAALGSTIDISWTVTNQGTEATTASFWSDGIYFSTDEFFDFSDTVLDFESIFDPLTAGESYTRERNVSLSSFSLAAGEGYLLVVTDGFRNQPEIDEDNNVTAIPFTLTVPDVDLVVSEVIAPDTAALGSSIDISWTVTNQGTETTTAFSRTDGIYFSTDEFFDFSDTFITNELISDPLAAGESYTIDRSVNIPDSLSAGEGYLLIVTDDVDSQSETDESNNVTAVPFTLVAPFDVDLVVTSVTAPSSVIIGTPFNISWTVTNQGTEATTIPSWEDRAYYSFDSIFGNDLYLGNPVVISDTQGLPLAPGESYTVNATVELTDSLGAGDYYIFVEADSLSYQPETDNTNNFASAVITGTKSPVDLELTSVNAPSSAQPGDEIELSWIVTNIGTEATDASSWLDNVYLYTGNDTISLGELIVSAPITDVLGLPLDPGESYTVNTTVKLPDTIVPGPYYPGFYQLRFLVDYDDRQAESNFFNNSEYIPITIAEVPDVDLMVSEVIAPDTALLGSSIDISWTVTNQGTEATTVSFWGDGIYFSTDEFFDFSDTFVTSEFIDNPLAGGNSYTIDRNVSLSSFGLEAGEGYLLVVTDGFDDQPETDEDNNVTAIPFTLTVPDVDLVVSEVIAPDTAPLGSSIDIFWTVTNQGREATTASFWEDNIFFSTDEFFDNSDTFIDFESIFNPLAGGESYTVERSVFLSSSPFFGLEAGEGYLLVVTDGFDDQPETDEDNNVTAIPFTLVEPEPPDVDLTIVDATATLNNSGTVDLTWTVVNQGTETAQRGFDSFFLSEDANFDRGVDRFITSSFNFPPIEGGGIETFRRLDLVFPAPNERYLIVVTDFTDDQPETDETNNVFAALITSEPPEPPDVDLVVSDIVAPSTAIRGSEIEISWIVANQGTETALFNWDDQIYFSTDETFDPFSDRLVDSEFISAQTPLAGGDSYTVERSLLLDPSIGTGNGFLLVVADGSEFQPETDETNNVRAVSITLTSPDVDLVISNVTTPRTATPGSSIDISWTVTNQGTETASADWFDYVYLSNNTTYDGPFGDDFYLTDVSIFSQTPLEAGDSYTINRSLALPGFGDRYLLFVTDLTDEQAESDETNNVLAVPITITVPLDGTAGADEIVGTLGDDTITGNQGRDTLTGNGGNDRFVYNSIIDAGDTITDFEPGVDTIVLAGVLDGLGYTGIDPIAENYIRFLGQGDDTFVQIDADGSGTVRPRNLVLVENVTIAELNNPINFEF